MKLVILDRDGVINEDSDQFIKNENEWVALPGSIEAITALSLAGFEVYIATNQSGLGRGLFTEEDLKAMHDKLQRLVTEHGGSIAGIFYCPHTPNEGCDCRKPEPGLLLQIQACAGRSLVGAPMIGDSLRDLEAGIAVGCKPILVKTGKGEKTWRQIVDGDLPIKSDLQVFDTLADAACSLLDGHR
jgi:D-glycero-D-manno-heptose 1,7-bisphosphate phosphatase